MKIEFLNDVKHDGNGGPFAKGDVKTVPDTLGEYFCDMGWVKDLDGNKATAPKDPNRRVTLDVAKVSHEQTVRV